MRATFPSGGLDFGFLFMPIDLNIADEAVARVGRQPEALIPILQALQERYGYLPEEALRRVCETTKITPAALAGVASFYDMFRMQPTGKHVVRVCRGTACHVAGAERVEDSLRRHLHIPAGTDTDGDGQFTIEQVACLGTCTLAPVVRIGESTMGYTTSEKVPELMRDYLENQAAATAVKSTEGKIAYSDSGTGVPPVRSWFEKWWPVSETHGRDARATTPGEIHVGLGSCCMAKGSDRLFHALRDSAEASGAKVTVKRVGCVGMCHRTPMIEVTTGAGKGEFYAGLSSEQARALLQRHFKPRSLVQRASRMWTRVLDGLLLDDASGQRNVQRFSMSKRDPAVRAFLDRQVHIATEHFGKLDPLDLDEYLSHDGFEVLARCSGATFQVAKVSQASGLQSESGSDSNPEGWRHGRKPEACATTPEEIISTIEKSGLRGRGGAGFPSGQKWRVVSEQASDTKYVICNGDEGDPGAFMDRMILESFPFRVIEGLAIAAAAVGAREGIFYIRHEYPLAVKRVRAAIAELEERGWLSGTGVSPVRTETHGRDVRATLKLSVFEGAGAFVCGEETALIASIEGERGMPKLRPPFPAQAGLWGKPTLINNVETLAMVPWIMRNGAEKFAAIGTAKSKGTKVFALAGKIRRGGLIEIPMGTTIREIVEEIGGGAAEGRRFKAVQIGGPSGGCVPARLADTPVDFESLREVGAIMGSGGLVVLDDSSCMVDIARYFLQFTQDQSCGKCTFCRIGTKRMLDILARLCTGKATRHHLEELERLAVQVGAGSLCGLGKTAPNPVLTTLKYFRDEYEAHLQGRCPARKCTTLIKYSINTDCTGCTICAQNCPVDAIPMVPYAQHVIDDAKCTRCDTCRLVCPHNAVEVK